MGIVSYAQNFEDVLLNRVFASTHYGFYVDVGAYHPVDDSVTKTFYDRGWDGINVEPGDVFDELAAARPRDINLRMAVHDHTGTVSFAQHPGWYAGLSHVQAGPLDPADAISTQSAAESRTVPCDTLANILDRHAKDRPIAFLKIDAEGSEGIIVRSTDWRAIRPLVVVIEATKPRSTILDNAEWEPVLLEAGYLRAYFDGINCFYVPDERADLLRNFELPVNVLDGFKRYDPDVPALHARAVAAEARAADVERKAAELAGALELSREREAKAEERGDTLQGDVRAVEDRLDAALRSVEALTASHDETKALTAAATAAAHADHVARLGGQIAEMEADRASLRRERDAVLGLRDEVLRLRRLLRELRWPEGPAALRAVLPAARLLRRLAGTSIPPVPPEELALHAPSVAIVPASQPGLAVAPPRRSLAQRAVWLVYRPFRPVGRPAALRLRAFLNLQLQAEFSRIDDKLNHLRDELGRLPAMPLAAPGQIADPRLDELRTEIRQFGKLLEDTLLTLAMEGAATGDRSAVSPPFRTE